jgi:hypothetical protein
VDRVIGGESISKSPHSRLNFLLPGLSPSRLLEQAGDFLFLAISHPALSQQERMIWK